MNTETGHYEKVGLDSEYRDNSLWSRPLFQQARENKELNVTFGVNPALVNVLHCV